MSKKRRRGKRNQLASQLVRGMKQFVRKLKSGEPIEATTVRREMTPDGPLTTRVKGMWNPKPITRGAK